MKITEFVICDDIRFERHNKVSLMGLYNDKIVLIVPDRNRVTWPVAVGLGFFVRIQSVENKLENEFGFSLGFSMNGKSLGLIDGSCSSASPSQAQVPVKISHFPLTEEGVLSFVFAAKDKSGSVLLTHQKTINVVIQEGEL